MSVSSPLPIRRREPVAHRLPSELSPILQRLYASRGLTSPEQLNLQASALHKPVFRGMSEAVRLLMQAMAEQRRILIVGDFDCDGATSSALMVHGLRAMGAQRVNYLVPNRFDYGYGLSPQVVEEAVALGAELLITVDNGISSISGVAAAKAAGMQVIVTDHHLPGDETPEADAIVNPNQHGCEFPSKNLAGVGVAFYLLLALRSALSEQGWFEQRGIRPPNMADYLDLVALGTVADVVALDGNNRVLVHQGLQRMRAGRLRPGIQALIDISGRNQQRLVASDLGFALGPRLNAVGRLDDMSMGVACLLCDDLNEARRLAAQMDELNRERKAIETSMQQEALATLTRVRISDGALPSGLVLHQDDWHQGVVGLVASRIKEQYFRPVIAFAEAGDDELKGSGRSIPGVHLRDLLEAVNSRHPGLIAKFGGHAMAAGLSITKAALAPFKAAFEQMVEEWVSPELLTGEILSDGELAPTELTLELAEQLRFAGPWGQAFPEPLFDGEFRIIQQRLVGDKHLKLVLSPDEGRTVIDAIAFNVDLGTWPNAAIQKAQLVYKLDVNEWRGRRQLQLLVERLAPL
ncbi:single-stranded-DNA-specific exonuclease RecJ [Oceanimonas sp. GK1]|uniref:single-stranded-DNA-specific exonuclease RecJ n=1 Tax=Oceanimonas sp. (strain GK1 / IBRC-M 10197) TaxID=511062 RepID=UPI00024953DE|nr:single-stranded-DNA-specific exonuclease RecJ [Oceanimonas sp. GK1]AEY02840.1 single-stranded-DNA-specific exonuclease RecJ [Oceanimonas sp. GK1]